MRIKDYPETEQLSANDKLLVDTNDGTRSILATNVGGGKYDNIYDMYDDMKIPWQMRRNVFRGEKINVDSNPTNINMILFNIQNGIFKNIFIGDYIEYDNVKYRVADINPFFGINSCFKKECCWKNHIVLIPDIPIAIENIDVNGKTSFTQTTLGGNLRSASSNKVLANKWLPQFLVDSLLDADVPINEPMGNGRVKTDNSFFNNLSNGSSDGKIFLPSFVHLYGGRVLTDVLYDEEGEVIKMGIADADATAIGKQLKLFELSPMHIYPVGLPDSTTKRILLPHLGYENMVYYISVIHTSGEVNKYNSISPMGESGDYDIRPAIVIG